MKEADFEASVIDLLCGMGWNPVYPVAHALMRGEDYRNPLFEARLSQVSRLPANRGVSADAIEEALRKVRAFDVVGLVACNEVFTDYLQNGVEVRVRRKGELVTEFVQLVDYEHVDANDFAVASQWTVQGANFTRRPDLVMFVNGLPLVVVELKSPSREATDEVDAYKQIRNYLQDIPELFKYNQICVTSDMLTSRAGTITSSADRFMEWKSVDGSYEDKSAAAFETFYKGLLAPARLLDIVRNFVCFASTGRGEPVKILAGYHQYFAVKKAVRSVTRACGEGGDGRGGVFWHTQGSGKSLSMVFFAKLMQRAVESPTFVVLTDRNDLDEQLYSQFARCERFLRQRAQKATSREDLKTKLKGHVANGIFFTTIQKFEEDDEPLSERRNIIVMADEAHRSHYGLAERGEVKVEDDGQHVIRKVVGTARIIRDSLPKATYIAFTGTPIDAKDRSTREVFGEYIDIYDMVQAEKDGATCPIYYESRVIKLRLNDDALADIDREYERLREEDEATEEAIEQSKKDLSHLQELLGHDETVETLVGDVVEHYEQYREKLLTGKVMLVAYDRRIAMKIYERMLEMRPAWKAAGKVAIVMTESNQDPESWREVVGNAAHRKELAVQFKDVDSPLKIVIVVDMWLTGFNVPSLSTMYIYKPMVGHNLMQAIARVNRVYEGKEGGLIVDYIGIAASLKEAMSKFTRGGRGGAGTRGGEIEHSALEAFTENFEICRDQLHGFDYTLGVSGTSLEQSRCVADALNFLLPPNMEKKRDAFRQAASGAHKALQLCAAVVEKSRREEAAFFEVLRVLVERHLRNAPGKLSTRDINEKISNLLRATVESEGVVNIFQEQEEAASLFSPAVLEELKKLPQRNLALEMLRGLLRKKLHEYASTNLVKSESFSNKLTETYNKYINGQLTNEEVFEELLELAKEIVAKQQTETDMGLTEEESAFYSALTAPRAVKDHYDNDQLCALTKELTAELRKNRTVDWQHREAARAGMRRLVRRLLHKYKYPPEEAQEALEIVYRQCELWADNAMFDTNPDVAAPMELSLAAEGAGAGAGKVFIIE